MNVGEDEGCRGEDGESQAVAIHRTASYLADRLDDPGSLAWYRKVAREVDQGTIRDVLTRVLDVPKARIRRSRAALFTALIRPHLPPRSLLKR